MPSLNRNSNVDVDPASIDCVVKQYGTILAWYNGTLNGSNLSNVNGDSTRDVVLGNLVTLATDSYRGYIPNQYHLKSQAGVFSSLTQTKQNASWLGNRQKGSIAFTVSRNILEYSNMIPLDVFSFGGSEVGLTIPGNRFKIRINSSQITVIFCENKSSPNGNDVSFTTAAHSGLWLLDYNSIAISWDFSKIRSADMVRIAINGISVRNIALEISGTPSSNSGTPNFTDKKLLMCSDPGGLRHIPVDSYINNIIIYSTALSEYDCMSLSMNMLNALFVGWVGQSNIYLRINNGPDRYETPNAVCLTGNICYQFNLDFGGAGMCYAGSHSPTSEFVKLLEESVPKTNGLTRFIVIVGFDAGGTGLYHGAIYQYFGLRKMRHYVTDMIGTCSPGNYIKGQDNGNIDEVIEQLSENEINVNAYYRGPSEPFWNGNSLIYAYTAPSCNVNEQVPNVSGIVRPFVKIDMLNGTQFSANYPTTITYVKGLTSNTVCEALKYLPSRSALMIRERFTNEVFVSETIKEYTDIQCTAETGASGTVTAGIAGYETNIGYTDDPLTSVRHSSLYNNMLGIVSMIRTKLHVMLTNFQNDYYDIIDDDNPWISKQSYLNLTGPYVGKPGHYWEYFEYIHKDYHENLKIISPDMILGVSNPLAFKAGEGWRINEHAIPRAKKGLSKLVENNDDVYFYCNDIDAVTLDDIIIRGRDIATQEIIDYTGILSKDTHSDVYLKITSSVSPANVGFIYKLDSMDNYKLDAGGPFTCPLLQFLEDGDRSDNVLPLVGDKFKFYSDITCQNELPEYEEMELAWVLRKGLIHYSLRDHIDRRAPVMKDFVLWVFGWLDDFGFSEWELITKETSINKRVEIIYGPNSSDFSSPDYSYAWEGKNKNGDYILAASATKNGNYIDLVFPEKVSYIRYNYIWGQGIIYQDGDSSKPVVDQLMPRNVIKDDRGLPILPISLNDDDILTEDFTDNTVYNTMLKIYKEKPFRLWKGKKHPSRPSVKDLEKIIQKIKNRNK